MTIHEMIFQFLGRWMSLNSASLGYAMLFVAVNCAMLWVLYRKRIFLRL